MWRLVTQSSGRNRRATPVDQSSSLDEGIGEEDLTLHNFLEDSDAEAALLLAELFAFARKIVLDPLETEQSGRRTCWGSQLLARQF
jgi:hypothetical protein